jgi:ketosteroid isomerase-like protein
MSEGVSAELPAVIRRLCAAIERRDMQALLDCFAPDYRSEQPLHPHDAYEGRAQIERTWSRPLRDARDLDVDLLRWAVDGDVIWTEWRWRGTWPNGTSFELAGVIIFGVADDHIVWGRLYMEPLPTDG